MEQPLTYGLAMRINGDPTATIDRLADEAAERGQRWLDEQADAAGISVSEFIRLLCADD